MLLQNKHVHNIQKIVMDPMEQMEHVLEPHQVVLQNHVQTLQLLHLLLMLNVQDIPGIV